MPAEPRTSVFAPAKTLMPGGFIPPEQMKKTGSPDGVSRLGPTRATVSSARSKTVRGAHAAK